MNKALTREEWLAYLDTTWKKSLQEAWQKEWDSMTRKEQDMTDRELLELAAKAAGYWAAEFNCPANLPRPDWNPLTDDGDALRLAVKLNLWEAVCDGYQHADSSDSDPYAATRRAIVRAAAEIGRSKT
jgi:hypothetical protein